MRGLELSMTSFGLCGEPCEEKSMENPGSATGTLWVVWRSP